MTSKPTTIDAAWKEFLQNTASDRTTWEAFQYAWIVRGELDPTWEQLRTQCQALWRTDVTLVCQRPKGHEGVHRSGRHTWNGECDVKSADETTELRKSIKNACDVALKLPMVTALAEILGNIRTLVTRDLPVETSGRVGPNTPNNDMVICPHCTSQFTAIPVNVQKRLQGIEQPVAWRWVVDDPYETTIRWRFSPDQPADQFKAEPLYTGTPPPIPSQSHVHCQGCHHGSEGCPGVQAREALPRYGMASDTERRARAEGRVEALEMLKGESAESFSDKYAKSVAIADTGDYDIVWDEDKLRELFEIAEVPYSMLDRLEMTYWTQQAYIDELKVLLNELWLPIEAAESEKDGRYILGYFEHDPMYKAFPPAPDNPGPPWVAAVRWSGSELQGWSMKGIGGLFPTLFRRITGPDGKPVGYIREPRPE